MSGRMGSGQFVLCIGMCVGTLLGGCSDSSKSSSKSDAASGKDGGTTVPASWSMMGYDSNNNYLQPNEKELTVDNAKDLHEVWRFEVGGYPPGSPVVANGQVFVMATGGLYAVKLEDGSLIWSHDDITGSASPAYADGFLYVHNFSGAGLYKLNANDGSIVWGPVATYPGVASCDGTSSPIVVGNRVLVGHSCGIAEVSGGDDQTNARGGVEAFSTDDGSPLWTYWTVPEEGENGAMVWSTVSVDTDAKVVFAATGNNYTMAGDNSDSIHAIDLETGERKWQHQVRTDDMWSYGGTVTATGTDTDFGANPILAEVNGQKVVANGDKGSAFWVLDRETGDTVWSYADMSDSHTPNNGGVLNNGAFDGTNFYVVSNQPSGGEQSMLHVLNGADGTDVRDPVQLDAIVWAPLSLANGLLFVPANHVLNVYDAATGDMLNSFETGGTIAAGAAAIVEGHVLVKSGLEYNFGTNLLSNKFIICYGLGPSHEPPDAGAPAADGGGVSDTSFSAIYRDILVGTGCTGTGLCHGGGGGKLDMHDQASAYMNLVGVAAMGTNPDNSGNNCADSGLQRVVAGDPDNSLLIQKVEGSQPCGTAMPPGGKLSDENIGRLRAWVENGAKDD
jgi:polyvinyl alcohol dehydrogenase (cytochrome)